MRHADSIERRIERLQFKAGTEMHKRILGDVLKTYDESEKAKVAASQPNVWRIIMKSRITKLAAAAAAVIVIAAVSITYVGELTAPAYGLDETFAALRKVRTVHAFCTDWDGSNVEIWVTLDPETGREQNLYAHTRQTGDVLLSTPEKTCYYYPQKNLVRVDKGLAPASDVRVGHFIEDAVKYITSEADGKIDIRREYRSERNREVIVLHAVSQKDEFVALIDPESKLPISMNVIRARGGMKSVDEIYYDQPLPLGVFEPQIPEDARFVIHRAPSDEVLNRPDAGIVVRGLDEEEACRQIVQQYWQAVIEQDWQKVQKLQPLPEKAWRQLTKYYTENQPAALVEVKGPYRDKQCWLGPIVSYTLQMVNGSYQTGDMIVKFRETGGEKSCVIAGSWGREFNPVR